MAAAPAQPSGPQVGDRDSLLIMAAPVLADWAALWRTALPGFRVDSLWAVRRSRWTPEVVGELEPDYAHKDSDADLAFELLGVLSPDGRYVLDIDNYQVIELNNGVLEAGGEPDSRSALIDKQSRTEATIATSGTGGGSHWGCWITPTTFALGGWREVDELGHWMQGSLSIVSIRDSTETTYVTRIVSASDYQRYVAGWNRWLMKRYRALASSRRVT